MIWDNAQLVRRRTDAERLTCILCPIGCSLTFETEADGSVAVRGNRCPRGREYALGEIRDPRRTVTATCAVEGADQARLPIRSSVPVPVAQIPAFLEALYRLRLRAPVAAGQIVGTDLGDTGIDAVSSLALAASRGDDPATGEDNDG